MHAVLAEIFPRLDEGRPLEAQALTVHCLKSVHQCFLDDGDGRLAWSLSTIPDPINKIRFGGTEKELEIVSAYTKSLDQLEEVMRRERGRDKEKDGDEQEEGKGRGKNRQPEAAAH